jgi:Ca2+-transporting ATPase
MTNTPSKLSTSESVGLSSEEAKRRLERDGPNVVAREPPPSLWKVLGRQFTSPMIWLLLGAGGVSFALGELADGIAILAIVILNALVGFFQEFRAEKALLALRSMTAPRARVVRDGQSEIIPAAGVVQGDLLLLEAGDVVAADSRLLEAHELQTNEAPLTGESLPVRKSTERVPEDAALAERRDSVFLGTSVVSGAAKAEVLAIGDQTELGKIARMLAEVEETESPLQKRLGRVTRVLVLACFGIVAVVAVVGLLRGQGWIDVLLTAISLSVAAVPEGLPAIVTIALALGVQRMAKRNVLVRRLHAVETLGATTVIGTDKTGTLTTGIMQVREVWGPDRRAILLAAASCCDAELTANGGAGDPMEVALLTAAKADGITRPELERENPRQRVIPFDSARKWMGVRRADDVWYVKGALDVLLPLCATSPAGVQEAMAEMGTRGLRILAIARGRSSEVDALEILGLIGLADPPRAEAIEAVANARSAGIRTFMITGDHPVTAHAIAREMGILADGEAPERSVRARATAEDKLKLIQAWKKEDDVVAMTGDGVNDAPALREAHVGIAMGRAGTEVTKEAADVILADDNFASIVAGIHEGRGIYENIRKTLVYLLAGNAAELFIMLISEVAGFPLPLLPLQLLWINLVSDGFPALALVMDPPDPDLLQKPPRPVKEPMLGRRQWMQVGFTAAVEGSVVFGVFVWALRHTSLDEARSLAFMTLVLSEVFRAFAARSQTKVFWETGVTSNLVLVGVVTFTMLVQLGLQAWAPTRELFGLVQMPFSHIVLAFILSLIPVTTLEVRKVLQRAWAKKSS